MADPLPIAFDSNVLSAFLLANRAEIAGAQAEERIATITFRAAYWSTFRAAPPNAKRTTANRKAVVLAYRARPNSCWVDKKETTWRHCYREVKAADS